MLVVIYYIVCGNIFYMEIIFNKEIDEIREIVEKFAKYQKIMLLYDNTASNTLLLDIEYNVREYCIFNKMNVENLGTNEIYNGYKLIIFLASVDNFLSLDIRWEEFVNIFLPTDIGILPFYLLENSIQNFILLDRRKVDIGAITSVEFNRIFSIIESLYNSQELEEFDSEISGEITLNKIIKLIENVPKNTEFIDIKIMKSERIEYRYIGLVDLILIDALYLFLVSIRNRTQELVDVYKLAHNDLSSVDKYYEMFNSNVVTEILNINYSFLFPKIKNARERIKTAIETCKFSNQEIVEIMAKVKNYAKNDNGIVGYLYLYNIFDV